MVEKRVDILFNFLTKGMAETIQQMNAQSKAISKLARPKSITEAVESSKIRNFNAELKALGNVSDRIRIPMKALTSAGWGMKEVFAMSMDTFKQVNKLGLQKNFTLSGKVANRIRMLTHGMRGFRMEMLGIMFFGMGMARFFSGLLKPAMDLTGIFDILNMTLGVVFLPVVLALLDPLLAISDLFMSLPESVKMAIGIFTVIGMVVGKIIFTIGMLALGIGSLILAFGKIFGMAAVKSVIVGIGNSLSGLAGLIGAVFAIIVVALIGFVLAWKENFGQIREWVSLLWDGLKEFFSGIGDIFTGIKDIIIGLFSGDSAKIIDGAKTLWEGVKKVFFGFLKFVGGFIVTLGLSLYRAFVGLLASLTDLLGKGFGLIWENLITPAYEFGKNLVLKIIEGIKSIGSQILDVILSFLPEGFGDFVGGLFNNRGGRGGSDTQSTTNVETNVFVNNYGTDLSSQIIRSSG